MQRQGGRGQQQSSYRSRGASRGRYQPSFTPRPKYATGGVSTYMDILSFVKSVQEIISDEKYLPLTDIAAREIIEGIKGILYPMNIKMTYENLVCLEKVEKMKALFKSKEKNKYVRFEGIENENQIIPRFRILMATNRHRANFQIPLVRQSNGIIIEIAEVDNKLQCNVLVVPSNDFNPNFNHAHAEEHVSRGDYDIYEINDGTTLNIYYDPHFIDITTTTTLEDGEYKTYKVYKIGKWLRSTKNAFDIDELIWRGFSYREIVNDVLKSYPEFDGSDDKLCYSIGFKHPAFHPFGQPEEWKKDSDETLNWSKYAWLIQVYDLKSKELLKLEPHPETHISKFGLPVQNKLEQQVLSFSEMLSKTQTSLNTFLSKGGQTPFLGYILRSKVPDISDILLESDLWGVIRHSIYQLPFIPNKSVREKQEHNFKSMQYVIIDAFLDLHKKPTFVQMFPQFESKYAELDSVINDVVNGIYDYLGKKKKKSEGSLCFELPSYDESPEQKRQKWIDLLIARLAPIISEQYQLTNEKSDKKMIKSLVANTKYSDIYASILDFN